MSYHKKQHFIPASYLKAWCDPNCPPIYEPYIWIYGKNSRIGKKKAPHNVFYESEMYTTGQKEGKRDLIIEHGFQKIEQAFTKLRDQKLQNNQSLNTDDLVTACLYIAAMHARTKYHIDHMSKEWNRILGKMDILDKYMRNASEEERKSAVNTLVSTNSREHASLSHLQVKRIVENPVDTIMLPMIQTEATLLTKLDFAVIYTSSNPGFITSDNPCIWFDAMASKRPFLFNAPSLAFKTIEITLPVSPSHCILLNRQGLNGYYIFGWNALREFNRRQRYLCVKHFVVNQNYADEAWYSEKPI